MLAVLAMVVSVVVTVLVDMVLVGPLVVDGMPPSTTAEFRTATCETAAKVFVLPKIASNTLPPCCSM